MICKLCLQEKILLNRSHIIPDFMFKDIYDENHKIIIAKYPDIINLKKQSSSYYDKNILCYNCDNVIIGKLETYASKVLFYGNKDISCSLISNQNGYRAFHVENIDCKKFKLFLLSILWRASISEQLFFKEISLGVHEEIIRQAIFNDDPLNETDYQICMFLMKKNDIFPREFVLRPIKLNYKDNPSFCFYINGAFFFFHLEKSKHSDIYSSGYITQSNKMEIPIIELDFVKILLNKIWGIIL